MKTLEYDEVGCLKKVNLHSNTTSSEYDYNIRSWLTDITGSKFSQSLSYGNGNGNIRGVNWSANGSNHSYSFTYDSANRMLNATHGTAAYTEKVTNYDKNGNIMGLQRYGGSLIDNLTYSYDGNQLTQVEDATNNSAGFSNGTNAANEYTYDDNGNLIKDSNKNITNIAYNVLNLPNVVTFEDGSTVTYTYAADGTKLRTVHTINATTTTKDYCANVVYENGVQKILLIEEGYVDLTASTPAYYYYLKDHQGNNRVVINSSGTISETNHYYPFGGIFASTGNVQPYKYNGKELDTKKGLNRYDYGARHYDATLGRWFVVDPLAEKYYSTSVYGYCLNNPVNIIDPLGTDTISVNNVNGKWDIIGVNVQSGDDVFRITIDGKTSVYTFGEGNYGNRMNILVLEGNENESLGIYHLSGTETAGYALQRGDPETAASGQKKRIPADVYNTYEGEGKLWPSYVGLKSDKVSAGRGIRVHYGENRGWSEGCILLSSNYKKVNGRTIFNLTESRNAVWNYVQYLGATNRQLNVLTPSDDNPNRRRDRYTWKDKRKLNSSNIIIKNK